MFITSALAGAKFLTVRNKGRQNPIMVIFFLYAKITCSIAVHLLVNLKYADLPFSAIFSTTPDLTGKRRNRQHCVNMCFYGRVRKSGQHERGTTIYLHGANFAIVITVRFAALRPQVARASSEKSEKLHKKLFCDKNKQRVLSDKKRLPRTSRNNSWQKPHLV